MSNVKLIRLTSGEEVIAKVIAETKEGVQVENPAILLPAGQGRLALVPWLPYAEAEKFLIPEKIVGFMVTPKSDLVNEYTTMTSGLLLPPKGDLTASAGPKLVLSE
jgi:hypothetical protein